MINVVVKLKAKSGKEDIVKKALIDMVQKVKDEEGTLIYTLHQLNNDPQTYMVYEKYKDQDAYAHHGSTSYFKELLEIAGPHLAGPLEIEQYEEIAAL